MAKTFKDIRIDAGYKSRKDLANALNTKKYNIDKWESGIAAPRAQMLPVVARTLKVSIDDLVKTLKQSS